MGDKKAEQNAVMFSNYSRGTETGRDAWSYNSSKDQLKRNVSSMIDFYNHELSRWNSTETDLQLKEFASMDTAKISWTSSLFSHLSRNKGGIFNHTFMRYGLYRPYTKQHVYFDPMFIHRVGQLTKIFPTSSTKNIVIQINAKYREGQIALISNVLPDLHCNGDSQCFPLYLFDEEGNKLGNGGEILEKIYLEKYLNIFISIELHIFNRL